MAGAGLEIDADDVLADLAEIKAHLTDMTPAMNAGAEALLVFVSDRFDTETGPDGIQWDPLDPDYLARTGKAARKPGKILTQTALLRNSCHAHGEPDSIVAGNPVVYAATHQYGDPERGIPARPFFPVDAAGEPIEVGPAETLWEEIEDTIADYVALVDQQVGNGARR